MNDWLLRRAERNYLEIELGEISPMEWSEELEVPGREARHDGESIGQAGVRLERISDHPLCEVFGQIHRTAI